MPNYPVKRAMLAGLAGGIAGGVIFRALLEGLPVLLVRVFGVTIIGAVIGLAISWVEEALREADVYLPSLPGLKIMRGAWFFT